MVNLRENFLWIFFSNRCELCGIPIKRNRKICANCEKNGEKLSKKDCHYCGGIKGECKCKNHRMKYNGVVSPYYYSDSIKRCIHRFKFNNKAFLGKILSQKMTEKVKKEYKDKTFDMVTYVPFSSEQMTKRKYNQSELLAEEISKNLSLPLVPTLEKDYNQGIQHRKKMSRRNGNVFGTYSAKNSNVKDKTILLVDDIKTSGSTLNECARELKFSGAKAVYCVTAAVTPKIK